MEKAITFRFSHICCLFGFCFLSIPTMKTCIDFWKTENASPAGALNQVPETILTEKFIQAKISLIEKDEVFGLWVLCQDKRRWTVELRGVEVNQT